MTPTRSNRMLSGLAARTLLLFGHVLAPVMVACGCWACRRPDLSRPTDEKSGDMMMMGCPACGPSKDCGSLGLCQAVHPRGWRQSLCGSGPHASAEATGRARARHISGGLGLAGRHCEGDITEHTQGVVAAA